MTTANKLETIYEIKSEIKKAIREKGVPVSNDFATYPNKIRSIAGGGSSGGDKLYLESATGIEIAKGEKVLVNYSDNGATIVELKQENFNPLYSFTGFATGKVDDLGRYEIELVLPEKVELTIVTNIDVADGDIIFEGAE